MVSIAGLSPFSGGLRKWEGPERDRLDRCPRYIYTGRTCIRHVCRAHTTKEPMYKTQVYVSYVGRIHLQSPYVHWPHGYGTRTASPPGLLDGRRAPRPSQLGLSGLGLVLALRGREEVIQHTAQVVKGGPVLWALLPAQHHEVVQLLRTVVRSHHAVASL